MHVEEEEDGAQELERKDYGTWFLATDVVKSEERIKDMKKIYIGRRVFDKKNTTKMT